MSSLKSSDTETRTPERGRPRGFENDAALEAAMLTFWEKGYHATLLDDLVASTGASRASLYKIFGDKRALFIRCLDLYGQRFEDRAEAALAGEPDARRVAEALLTASAERLSGSSAPAGCLRCNSTLELMGLDPELDRALDAANARYLAVMRRVVGHAVASGQLAPNHAADLPLFLTGVINGMVTLSRSGVGADALHRYVATALQVWPVAEVSWEGGSPPTSKDGAQ